MQAQRWAVRVAAATAVAVALAWGSGAGLARAEEPVTIALLPVVVHSNEDPSYLRAGLADMLVARLDQTRAFQVQRIEDPALATSRVSEALATGRKLGVDFVLFGSFTRFGQGASLDMQCASTTAAPDAAPLREIFVHSGSIGNVIPDLDSLVGKVTRFAIEGYRSPAASASAAPAPTGTPAAADGGSGVELRAIEARVEALEASIDELRDEIESRDEAPGE